MGTFPPAPAGSTEDSQMTPTHIIRTALMTGLVATFGLTGTAIAQETGGLPDVAARVTALEHATSTLQSQVSTLQSANAALQTQVNALQTSDAALSTALAHETAARQEADSKLQASLDALQGAFSPESTMRANQDASL